MLPTLKQLMDEEGYVLSRVDCGLPSQTSACQAGIMFGDNYDIPAFRWYDKDRQKLLVSGSDAAEINARYAKGNGLMRGGSSINNMLNGDAEKAILRWLTLKSGTADEKKRRARDIYLLVVNPYFLMRTIVLMLGDALREMSQYRKARLRNVQPRLDRLHHGYPLLRAAAPSSCAMWRPTDGPRHRPRRALDLRHLAGLRRGGAPLRPVDERCVRGAEGYDPVIRQMRDYILDKAPRPYDLIILSDHGQSFGATFLQRYGCQLKEFIESTCRRDDDGQHIGGDTGLTHWPASPASWRTSSSRDGRQGRRRGGEAGPAGGAEGREGRGRRSRAGARPR